jgi:hypothetical protein
MTRRRALGWRCRLLVRAIGLSVKSLAAAGSIVKGFAPAAAWSFVLSSVSAWPCWESQWTRWQAGSSQAKLVDWLLHLCRHGGDCPGSDAQQGAGGLPACRRDARPGAPRSVGAGTRPATGALRSQNGSVRLCISTGAAARDHRTRHTCPRPARLSVCIPDCFSLLGCKDVEYNMLTRAWPASWLHSVRRATFTASSYPPTTLACLADPVYTV